MDVRMKVDVVCLGQFREEDTQCRGSWVLVLLKLIMD